MAPAVGDSNEDAGGDSVGGGGGGCCGNCWSSSCHGRGGGLPLHSRWLRGLAYLLLYFLAFMPCIALLFMAIEGPIEDSEKAALRLARSAFLDNHSCLTDAQLERYLATVIAANNRGVSALRNASDGRSNWSFGQALFFATTVVTTIGYGRTAPLSHLGKAMCIAVALIGIPLTLLVFSLIAGWLRRLSLRGLTALRARLPARRQSLAELLHLCLLFLGLLLCFLVIPAAAFVSLERDWSYLDAFYYCVISLTTVGLGDFIVGEHPDQENRLVYKVSAVVYLYTGLAFVVFALRSFADVPSLNPGRYLYTGDGDGDGGDNGDGDDGGFVGVYNEGAKLITAESLTTTARYSTTNAAAASVGSLGGGGSGSSSG